MTFINKSKCLINHIRRKLLEMDQNILDFGKLRNNFSWSPVIEYTLFIHTNKREIAAIFSVNKYIGFIFRTKCDVIKIVSCSEYTNQLTCWRSNVYVCSQLVFDFIINLNWNHSYGYYQKISPEYCFIGM